ncbi:MAG: hypothetical protein P3X22_002765 [Thermoprotei archaeon]|nr:hypothetical protein [Thermoprotei archaeon]
MVKLYVAWRSLPGRGIGSRALVLSRMLGAKLFILAGAPPYIKQIVNTVRLIALYRPSMVMIELPQGPLLLLAVLLKFIYGFMLLADVHTGFIVYSSWKGYLLNKPFTPLLRFVDLIIVHNNPISKLLPRPLRVKTLVVYDPPRFTPQREDESDYILLPVSWREDEPIEYILEEFLNSNTPYKLIVTGDYNRRSIYEKFKNSGKIVFTGYVSETEYLNLLGKAKAVIVVSSREYTLTSSGWETIYAQKIPIVSETKTLRELFKDSAIYFKIVKGGLAKALETLCDPEISVQLKHRVSKLRDNLLNDTINQLRTLMKLVNYMEQAETASLTR